MAERVVTALKVQKRNPNRVNVYLDGEFAFGLARIVAAWLTIGASLSDEKITQLTSQDEVEAAYQKALQFIDYRPRSEAEVSRRLKEKGIASDVVDQVLERMRHAGLLADAAFAQSWVENRSAFRPRGRRLLAMELRQKGISEEVIQESLPEDEAEEGLALLAGRKYMGRLHQADWEMFQRKMGGFLLRRGFPYSVVKPVLHQLWDERQTITEIPMKNDEAEDVESE